VPKLRPNFFSILGVRFSDKSLTYALGLQLALADGRASALPMLSGCLLGALYMANVARLQSLTWPRPLRALCRRVVLPLLDGGPPPLPGAAGAGPRQQHGVGRGGGRRGGGDDDDDGAAAAVAAIAALQQQAAARDVGLPAPDPAAVDRLCALGFPRAAVERALRECFNDENAAANRLLGG
jgi:hypothetical protein